jgi:hypothetical protein
MSDFALDKLRALGERVPPEESTPELVLLLAFAEASEAAEGKLRAVKARWAMGDAPEELLQAPEAFQASALAAGWG